MINKREPIEVVVNLEISVYSGNLISTRSEENIRMMDGLIEIPITKTIYTIYFSLDTSVPRKTGAGKTLISQSLRTGGNARASASRSTL